jgi:hypothetical protein
MDNELLRAIDNITNDIAPFWDLIFVVAYILGGVSVLSGLFMFGRDKGQGHGAGYATIVFGTLLLGLPTVLDTVSQTLFLADAPAGLAGSGGGGGGVEDTFVRFAVTIARLTGLCGVVKGLAMLRKVGSGSESNAGHAVIFIVAGVICLNIVTFMNALGVSVGGTFQQVVSRLFAGG